MTLMCTQMYIHFYLISSRSTINGFIQRLVLFQNIPQLYLARVEKTLEMVQTFYFIKLLIKKTEF